MLKKTLLCSALAITALTPIITCAVSPNDTAVTNATTPTQTNSNAQNAVNDVAITDQIKALYQKSSLVNEQTIQVTTTNHDVILQGKVDTDMQYERAVALAESVSGVGEVNADNLLVKDSKSPLADTFITAKVKGAIMKEKLFGDKDVEYWPVSVETKNSVVYLAGDVDTEEQRNNIVGLVKKVKGVQSVKSSLNVNKDNNGESNPININHQNNNGKDDNNTNYTE